MNFKQELVNVIKDKTVAWVFCDESCRTAVVLGKTVLLSNKPANCISVSFCPRTQKYCLQSFYWLSRFKHPIYKKTTELTKPEVHQRLKGINSELEQSA